MITKFTSNFIRKINCLSLVFIFACASVVPPSACAQAQLELPAIGTMVATTANFTPVIIKGITLNPQNALQFDFLIDTGDTSLNESEFKDESMKLVKYFLAALTIPEKDMWVNLSPYEKDRIIAENLKKTRMGSDLLVQDYLLKQLTSSLMFPEKEIGKEFWDKVYAKAQAQFGSTDIPLNTFNKIWIVPDKANVVEHKKGAFVTGSHLKVMLEEDYVALKKNLDKTNANPANEPIVSGVSSDVVREVLIPEIEREVNEGKTFANLRQIFNSMILATWYKQNLKTTLLGQLYSNKNKVKNFEGEEKASAETVYDQYVESFKEGVFNIIREDYDPQAQEVVQRKYFSGGFSAAEELEWAVTKGTTRGDFAVLAEQKLFEGEGKNVSINMNPQGSDAASLVEVVKQQSAADAAMGGDGYSADDAFEDAINGRNGNGKRINEGYQRPADIGLGNIPPTYTHETLNDPYFNSIKFITDRVVQKAKAGDLITKGDLRWAMNEIADIYKQNLANNPKALIDIENELKKIMDEINTSTSSSTLFSFPVIVAAMIDQQTKKNGNAGYVNLYFPRDMAFGLPTEATLDDLAEQQSTIGLFHLSRASMGISHYDWASNTIESLVSRYPNKEKFLDQFAQAIEEHIKEDKIFEMKVAEVENDLRALGYFDVDKIQRIRFIDTGYKTFPLFLQALFRLRSPQINTEGLVMEASSTVIGILPQFNLKDWQKDIREAILRNPNLSRFARASWGPMENDGNVFRHPMRYDSNKNIIQATDLRSHLSTHFRTLQFVLAAIRYNHLLKGMTYELVEGGVNPDDAKGISQEALQGILGIVGGKDKTGTTTTVVTTVLTTPSSKTKPSSKKEEVQGEHKEETFTPSEMPPLETLTTALKKAIGEPDAPVESPEVGEALKEKPSEPVSSPALKNLIAALGQEDASEQFKLSPELRSVLQKYADPKDISFAEEIIKYSVSDLKGIQLPEVKTEEMMKYIILEMNKEKYDFSKFNIIYKSSDFTSMKQTLGEIEIKNYFKFIPQKILDFQDKLNVSEIGQLILSIAPSIKYSIALVEYLAIKFQRGPPSNQQYEDDMIKVAKLEYAKLSYEETLSLISDVKKQRNDTELLIDEYTQKGYQQKLTEAVNISRILDRRLDILQSKVGDLLVEILRYSKELPGPVTADEMVSEVKDSIADKVPGFKFSEEITNALRNLAKAKEEMDKKALSDLGKKYKEEDKEKKKTLPVKLTPKDKFKKWAKALIFMAFIDVIPSTLGDSSRIDIFTEPPTYEQPAPQVKDPEIVSSPEPWHLISKGSGNIMPPKDPSKYTTTNDQLAKAAQFISDEMGNVPFNVLKGLENSSDRSINLKDIKYFRRHFKNVVTKINEGRNDFNEHEKNAIEAAFGVYEMVQGKKTPDQLTFDFDLKNLKSSKSSDVDRATLATTENIKAARVTLNTKLSEDVKKGAVKNVGEYIKSVTDSRGGLVSRGKTGIQGGGFDGTTHERFKGADHDWMFKVYPSHRSHRVLVDELVSDLSHQLKLTTTMNAYAGKMDGRFGIFVQWQDNQGSLWDEVSGYGKNFPKHLSREQLVTIVREQVLDWLISNHDPHTGHFLKTAGGGFLAIDKTQAFKYLGQSNERLSIRYNPNAIYNGESNLHYMPIYNLVIASIARGEAALSLEDARSEVMHVIAEVEKMDSGAYREKLLPYAAFRFDVVRSEEDKKTGMTREKFLDLAVQRKENLRKDFDYFYANVKADSALTAEKEKVGGIDLNSNMLNMNVDKNEGGFNFDLPQSVIGDFDIDGFIPTIINITPITNLPLLMGLSPAKPQDKLSYTNQN